MSQVVSSLLGRWLQPYNTPVPVVKHDKKPNNSINMFTRTDEESTCSSSSSSTQGTLSMASYTRKSSVDDGGSSTQDAALGDVDHRAWERAGRIVGRVLDAHARLTRLADLRPGDEVNEILGGLVELCCQIHDGETTRRVLADARLQAVLPSLRAMCATAESCLEAHWARHITLGSSTQDEETRDEDSVADVVARLESFPYYRNYEELTRLELCAIASTRAPGAPPPRRVAFLGSGPLPLTSWCLVRQLNEEKGLQFPATTTTTGTGVQVLNVDREASAIAASAALNARLGAARGAQGMSFRCADAGEMDDLAGFDVVYLAALVGGYQAEKEALVAGIARRMRRGALLVVRTSWGLRTCLYAEVDMTTEKMSEHLEVCVVVHPYGNVVNSVIVARVK